MSQDELWLTKNKGVMDFRETNHRNPSRLMALILHSVYKNRM